MSGKHMETRLDLREEIEPIREAKPLRAGEIRFGPDSAMRWLVLDRDLVEAAAKEFHGEDAMQQAAAGLGIEAGWLVQPYYHGPGRGFADTPGITVGRTRVLVRQFGGRDV